jgi:hypothetical protein
MKLLLLIYFPVLLLFLIGLLNWRVSTTSITGRPLELKTGMLWKGLRWSGLGLASLSVAVAIWLAVTNPDYFLGGVFSCAGLVLIATVLLLFGTTRRFTSIDSRNAGVEQTGTGNPIPPRVD